MTAINEIKPKTEFGYLKVINQGESDTRGAARYWCVCQAPGCGKRLLIKGQRLRTGQRSCGCRRGVAKIAFAFHRVEAGLDRPDEIVPCNKPSRCPHCADENPRV